jgi:hypothetical protein
MRTRLAPAATLFVLNAVTGIAFAQEATDPTPQRAAPPQRELLQPPKKDREASPITDRFALRVSWFHPSVDTTLRLDETLALKGTTLNAESDLGMPDSANMARVEMIFRLRERNRLRVDYLKLSRYGDKVLDETIRFGNQTFTVNDRAQTSLDYRNLGLTWTYSLLRFDRFELGAGIGIALLEAHAKGEVIARNLREKQDGIAPFPTAALDITWRISKRFAFNARGQGWSAQRSSFTGSMADYHGDIQYRWARNFAFGLGYTKLRIRAESESTDNLPGKFNQDIAGPELFIRASF